MKNNRGFTLVELLAVITILAIVAIATLEAIDSVNRGNKEKAETVHIQNILSSAIAYVPTSEIILPDITPNIASCKTIKYKTTGNDISDTTSICIVEVYLSKLVSEGILEDNLTNPLKNKDLNMDRSYVKIVYLTPATRSYANALVGKFDGSYFYELKEEYN